MNYGGEGLAFFKRLKTVWKVSGWESGDESYSFFISIMQGTPEHH